MPVRTHAYQLTVEQGEAVAEAIAKTMVTKSIAAAGPSQEVAEVGESSAPAEEPCAMRQLLMSPCMLKLRKRLPLLKLIPSLPNREKRSSLILLSRGSGGDIGRDGSLTVAPSICVDEAGPSRTTAPPTVKSVPISLSKPDGIASSLREILEPSSSESIASLRATLEPSSSGLTDILRLTRIRILLAAAARITDEDMSIRTITDPHASLVKPLADQFFIYLSTIMPILLQDTGASRP